VPQCSVPSRITGECPELEDLRQTPLVRFHHKPSRHIQTTAHHLRQRHICSNTVRQCQLMRQASRQHICGSLEASSHIYTPTSTCDSGLRSIAPTHTILQAEQRHLPSRDRGWVRAGASALRPARRARCRLGVRSGPSGEGRSGCNPAYPRRPAIVPHSLKLSLLTAEDSASRHPACSLHALAAIVGSHCQGVTPWNPWHASTC
jgi:hypothetical protein